MSFYIEKPKDPCGHIFEDQCSHFSCLQVCAECCSEQGHPDHDAIFDAWANHLVPMAGYADERER